MKPRFSLPILAWLAAILLSWPSLAQVAGLHALPAAAGSPLGIPDADIIWQALSQAGLLNRVPGAASCPNPYVVRAGDTLSAIARRCGVTVENLRRWNNLFSYTIWPGQWLITRSVAVAPRAQVPGRTPTPSPARTPIPRARPLATPTPQIEPTISRW